MPLRGCFRALLLYDVAEEFDLAALSRIIGVEPPARSPGFKLPAPDYVRFERPPVMEGCESVLLGTGEAAKANVRYFEYGVVSLELETPFETDWPGLIALSNRWIEAGEVERKGLAIVRDKLARLAPATKKPYPEWLDEVYYIIELSDVDGHPTGAQLLERYGREVSQVIRGETQPLSDAEQKEVLSNSLSYYPADLIVVGWLAALVYDTPAGAVALIQILEYANTQLLEYRRYDEILSALLQHAYGVLDRRTGLFSRWRLAREAERLNQLRLDVTDLAERTDNAIKFLSDMYYARSYRLAAAKVGANDYRDLVDEKLRTLGELYEFMVNEFREARSFVLELFVALLILIELWAMFKGK